MAIYGLSAAGQGGDQVGKPPWWLARGFFVPLPFLLPIAAAAFAAANHRWSRRVGLLAAAAIGVVAVIDRIDSPGVAAAEGVTALIGVLCTLAATAGRVPPVSG